MDAFVVSITKGAKGPFSSNDVNRLDQGNG